MRKDREELMKRLVRMARAAAVAGAMMAPAAAMAQGAMKPVVAVLRFDNNSIGKDATDYDGIGKAIQAMLITDMTGDPKVTVVDRDHIEELLREQHLVREGAVDPATAVRIGKLLGAQYMIAGGFMSDGRGTMVLTAHSINVETSAIGNPTRVQQKTDDVLGLIAQLSAKLSRELKLPALEHATGAADRKMDLHTAMLYAKALDAQDNGDTAKAIELYRQVLTRFPNYSPATARLDKLTGKSGS